MKTNSILAAATALLASTGVNAKSFRRNAHANAHANMGARSYSNYNTTIPALPSAPASTCHTYVTGVWVPYNPPQTYASTAYVQSTVTVVPVSSSAQSTSTSTSTAQITVTVTPSYAHPVPTPSVTTCPTPGTYTIPATTVTLSSTETVCVPTTTVLTPGSYTVGQSTTIVSTSTVVTCPYATVVSSTGTVYTTIHSTVITCPYAGSYTYGGMTTSATETSTCTYPVVTEYPPATYTQTAQTVTVVSTAIVVTCPYENSKPTTSAAPAPVAPTTYAPPPVVYSSPAPAPYSAPAPSPVAPSSSASAIQSTYAAGSTAGISHVGSQWAITYSPYNDDSSCRSTADMQSDIADIASRGFSSVRLYAPECGALATVGSSCELHGMKLIVGIFINGPLDSAEAQLQSIISWGQWDLVEMIVVGNEAVFNGWISASDLASFIVSCKAKLTAAGCNAPVTTSETLNILQDNQGLCNVIDVVGINIQPFFNSGVQASDAGDFLIGQLKLAESVCGKTAYCLEAGWPSAGSPNGAAVPGTSDQATALSSIRSVDNGHIAYFTYRNDGWKKPGVFDVEQNFGCADLFSLH